MMMEVCVWGVVGCVVRGMEGGEYMGVEYIGVEYIGVEYIGHCAAILLVMLVTMFRCFSCLYCLIECIMHYIVLSMNGYEWV